MQIGIVGVNCLGFLLISLPPCTLYLTLLTNLLVTSLPKDPQVDHPICHPSYPLPILQLQGLHAGGERAKNLAKAHLEQFMKPGICEFFLLSLLNRIFPFHSFHGAASLARVLTSGVCICKQG
jgi:hypothetical protein